MPRSIFSVNLKAIIKCNTREENFGELNTFEREISTQVRSQFLYCNWEAYTSVYFAVAGFLIKIVL